MAGKTDIVIPAFTNKQLTVKGDAELLPQNIRKGINLFGVLGTMEEGIKGIDYGTVTVSGSSTDIIEVQHNLGKIPTFAVLVRESIDYVYESFTSHLEHEAQAVFQSNTYLEVYEVNGAYGNRIVNMVRESSNCLTKTESSLTFKSDEFSTGTYYWFAVA